jgi:hypothetical protein
MNAAANHYEIQLTPAEENYYAAMKELGEFGLIGAGPSDRRHTCGTQQPFLP